MEEKKYIVMNEKRKEYIVGNFFSISKTEAGIYDEKTAELILNLIKMKRIKGYKGFQKFAYVER